MRPGIVHHSPLRDELQADARRGARFRVIDLLAEVKYTYLV